MSKDVNFHIEPVSKKPTRKYRKPSKYDAVLEAFIKANVPLSEVSVEDKTASYLAVQLGKRIDAVPEFKHLAVSTANSQCFLENPKAQPKEEPKKKK